MPPGTSRSTESMVLEACSTETSLLNKKRPVGQKGLEVIQMFGARKPGFGSAVSMDVWV
jgi:hypothetical protein